MARRGEKRNASGVWWGNLKGRNHLDDTNIDGGIILKKLVKRAGLDSAGIVQGQSPGICEHGAVHSDFLKCGEYLE